MRIRIVLVVSGSCEHSWQEKLGKKADGWIQRLNLGAERSGGSVG
jgi:hypothetical protein